MDWRVEIFSNAVIMTAMSKHLTLRDVGNLAALCKWSEKWRKDMTTAFRMRMRLAKRWPRGTGINKRSVDMIAAVQSKARQALLPVAQGKTFECWMGGCYDARKRSIEKLCDSALMPYASCFLCVSIYAPRHVRYAWNPNNFASRLIAQRLKLADEWCEMIDPFLLWIVGKPARSYVRLDMLVPTEQIAQCKSQYKGDIISPSTTWYHCDMLQALVDKAMHKHDMYNKWTEYCALCNK